LFLYKVGIERFPGLFQKAIGNINNKNNEISDGAKDGFKNCNYEWFYGFE
jgi:hypothetical protein